MTVEPIRERDPAEQRERTAEALMRAFAARTGIAASSGTATRYLWTDAFAVCNFLALHRATGARSHLVLAETLVARVHDVLGRHRGDDGRSGWISGLPADEGRRHPTCAGLRIGKPLPERQPGEPFDHRLEWDRDGQYFHYLTRWAHALARMAHATEEIVYLEWAIELAAAAHRAFVFTDAHGRRRMHWKMSVDLQRPLVATMGHHDPLDGILMCLELQAAADELPGVEAGARLAAMLDDLRGIANLRDWTTEDPLGIGGLLTGAGVLAQLLVRGSSGGGCSVAQLLECARAGLDRFEQQLPLGPAAHRLAFRELGLAIGLHAVPRIAALARQHGAVLGGAAVTRCLDSLGKRLRLAATIEQFWLDPANRAASSRTDHRDIDEVMLATSLVPDGCLDA